MDDTLMAWIERKWFCVSTVHEADGEGKAEALWTVDSPGSAEYNLHYCDACYRKLVHTGFVFTNVRSVNREPKPAGVVFSWNVLSDRGVAEFDAGHVDRVAGELIRLRTLAGGAGKDLNTALFQIVNLSDGGVRVVFRQKK